MIKFDEKLKQLETKLNIHPVSPQEAELIKKSVKPVIMIVDDDPLFLSSLGGALKADCRVIQCSNAGQTMEALDQNISVAILDIKMRGVNGLELSERIAEKYEWLPVIFNTGYPGDYLENEIYKKYKPFAYVTKDQPEILLTHIRSAIRHSELTKKNVKLISEYRDANTALKVIIKSIETEKAELIERISQVLQKMVMPLVEELDGEEVTGRQREYISLIRSAIDNLTSSFAIKLTSTALGLTTRELQVAMLVKKGHTTAEIGRILCISDNAIALHRKNIRSKLGLTSKKINLKEYLEKTFVEELD